MENSNIKKLITEAVQEAIAGEKLQSDIPYLKDFHFFGSKIVNGNKVWKYVFKTNDNSYIIDAFFTEYANDVWRLKIDIYWKIKTKANTAGAGRDFAKTFGPYAGYQEMISELSRVLTNNPLIAPENYSDDFNFSMDKEILRLFLMLKEKIGEIRELNNPVFKSLEKVYDIIKDVPEEELLELADKIAPSEQHKQTIILDLQMMDKIPYYKSIRDTHSDFKNKPYSMF